MLKVLQLTRFDFLVVYAGGSWTGEIPEEVGRVTLDRPVLGTRFRIATVHLRESMVLEGKAGRKDSPEDAW